jgi:hypothetical protein
VKIQDLAQSDDIDGAIPNNHVHGGDLALLCGLYKRKEEMTKPGRRIIVLEFECI